MKLLYTIYCLRIGKERVYGLVRNNQTRESLATVLVESLKEIAVWHACSMCEELNGSDHPLFGIC